MERIETLNLKTETDALEAGHGMDARDVPDHAEHTERVGDFQTGNPSPGHPPRSVCRAENNNETLKNQPI